MADHRSLTESVLQRGEALLECMASNSPGERGLWVRIEGVGTSSWLLAGTSGSAGIGICPQIHLGHSLEVLMLPHALTLLHTAPSVTGACCSCG